MMSESMPVTAARIARLQATMNVLAKLLVSGGGEFPPVDGLVKYAAHALEPFAALADSPAFDGLDDSEEAEEHCCALSLTVGQLRRAKRCYELICERTQADAQSSDLHDLSRSLV